MFSSQNSQVSNDAVFVEDVFSTYLYTGNGSTQTITNGIDLSGKGGLVWTKNRLESPTFNYVLDSARDNFTQRLITSLTAVQSNGDAQVTPTSSGFSLSAIGVNNDSGRSYVSWTFRKQPKFFDVVTYTGNGTAGRQIAHSLGSTPGFLVVKNTATSGTDWNCWHRSIPTSFTVLNATYAANAAGAAYFGNGSTAISPTSTVFTVSDALDVNASGQTYVAYLFAHDAGGFGLTGTDNVISCGSYTTDGSGNFSVNLGYEPQWIMVKRTSSTGNWLMFDNMRGLGVDGTSYVLYADVSNAEAGPNSFMSINSTGFGRDGGTAGQTFIYIAIRRGPMKVPTSGTSVFEPVTSTSANFIKGTLEASDMGWFKDRATVADWFVGDRLRGIMSYYNPTLYTNLTNAEATPTTGDTVTSTSSEGTGNGKIYFGGAGATTDQPLGYSFKRAPSFFDEVCYTGTGNAMTVNHNLGVAPELMIVKGRSGATGWVVYTASTGATKYMRLDNTNAAATLTAVWNDTAPTSSVFTVGSNSSVNTASATYVAYLFATCAGVSKVGSYTGNGSSQTINCGFTSGARFVLIKATSAAGQWRVYDTARGIVAGNEPELFLNLTDAEQTVYDAIDTASSGFIVNSNGANVNDSGVTYIFLAIA